MISDLLPTLNLQWPRKTNACTPWKLLKRTAVILFLMWLVAPWSLLWLMPLLHGGGLPARRQINVAGCSEYGHTLGALWRWTPHNHELAEICETAVMKPFENVIKDSNRVPYDLYSPEKMHDYNRWTRPHQHVLPIKNLYAKKNSGKNAVGYNLCILS